MVKAALKNRLTKCEKNDGGSTPELASCLSKDNKVPKLSLARNQKTGGRPDKV